MYTYYLNTISLATENFNLEFITPGEEVGWGLELIAGVVDWAVGT